jgi:hypothetical protein
MQFSEYAVRSVAFHTLKGIIDGEWGPYDDAYYHELVDDFIDEVKKYAPEYCPGHEDPRCRGACTLIGRSVDGKLVIGEGAKIMDPDCFR